MYSVAFVVLLTAANVEYALGEEQLSIVDTPCMLFNASHNSHSCTIVGDMISFMRQYYNSKFKESPNNNNCPEQHYWEGCRLGWHLKNGHCYRMFKEAVTMNEAKAKCAKENSNPVSIGSEEEYTHIYNIFNGENSMYISLTYNGTWRDNGNWRWFDGSSLSSEPMSDEPIWVPGYPKNESHNRCVIMLESVRSWKNVNCSMKHYFMCEYDSNESRENDNHSLSSSEAPHLTYKHSTEITPIHTTVSSQESTDEIVTSSSGANDTTMMMIMTSTTEDDVDTTTSKVGQTAAIAGSIAGLLLIVVVVAVACIVRKRRKAGEQKDQTIKEKQNNFHAPKVEELYAEPMKKENHFGVGNTEKKNDQNGTKKEEPLTEEDKEQLYAKQTKEVIQEDMDGAITLIDNDVYHQIEDTPVEKTEEPLSEEEKEKLYTKPVKETMQLH
ncbi:hypothetical protein CAPTEDRAFT_223162 [Capitella teleta]|uniref:C-type lectin domain-containing protein n=1 Tax=Capitella teleta TaxID=283909 RepID=R7V273_CAPTE|nr:hypothetical protein CAPTEDRAFT_223162 [Capitella teleta]|eukprot:ELU12953.1 hypothetical protein CAPTEDRAFT_223162 [Capitella teleta]